MASNFVAPGCLAMYFLIALLRAAIMVTTVCSLQVVWRDRKQNCIGVFHLKVETPFWHSSVNTKIVEGKSPFKRLFHHPLCIVLKRLFQRSPRYGTTRWLVRFKSTILPCKRHGEGFHRLKCTFYSLLFRCIKARVRGMFPLPRVTFLITIFPFSLHQPTLIHRLDATLWLVSSNFMYQLDPPISLVRSA